MGHVQAKPTIESKTETCPFCNKGKIDVIYTSEHMTVHSTFSAGGRKKMMPNYHPEKYDVSSKCPVCGASKNEIKKALERGTTKEISHEERIRRLKEAGLPTKIETKS